MHHLLSYFSWSEFGALTLIYSFEDGHYLRERLRDMHLIVALQSHGKIYHILAKRLRDVSSNCCVEKCKKSQFFTAFYGWMIQ